MNRISSCLLLLAFFAGCASLPSQNSESLWLHGGKVWTGDTSRPKAEAILISHGKISAVGSEQEVSKLARKVNARSYDLHGRTVVPGFIDAHVHILSGGFSLERLDLSSAKTREATLREVQKFAKDHPNPSWILGRGWSYNLWKPGFPTREELDKVVPDRPVYLRSYDGHSGWANTLAIKMAGLDEKTPDPKGGNIIREKDTAYPQGTFLEEATELISKNIPKPTVEERNAAIQRALFHAAKRGVTTLCEVGDSLENLSIYEKLDQEGKLPVRVVYGPSIDDGIEAYAKERQKLLSKRTANSMLTPGPLKGFVDGVIESNTAVLLKPYADGSGKGTGPHLVKSVILEQIRKADRLGMDVAYHAIGDSSVRSVLEAIEEIEKTEKARERRPRIEHIEVIAKEDLPRFASLGVIASMMPAHADPGEEPNGGVWSKKVGSERLHRAFAFSSLDKAHAKLAFGSDWPVVPIDPLPALAIAATRQGSLGLPKEGWIPEQRIPIETALTGYTSGSAYAVRLEKETGTLKPEMNADLVVLSPEADLSNPSSLFKAQVDLTMAAGKVVYERKPTSN